MPREFARFLVPLEIVLEYTSGRREARISDLSMTGCFVDSILQVSEGELMNFNLQVSVNESLRLSGEVVYSMPNIGFGIRFIGLSEEEKFLLAKSIIEHGGNPDGPPN